MNLYFIYKDDGPVGVCGQTVDITNPREKLYIISGKNEEEIRLELKKLENDVTNLRRVRLNARLTGGYWEGNEWEHDDVKRISCDSVIEPPSDNTIEVLSDLLQKRASLLQERTRLSVIRQASPVLGRRILRSRSRQVAPNPAQPEKMPTLHQLSDWWEAHEESVLGFKKVGDSRVEHHDAIKIAIAALHDWASHCQSHPHPVPVSERPILKSNPFNDELGRCWCGTKEFVDNTGDCPIEYPASWEFREPDPQDDCLLPANAIPQPQTLK